MHIHVAYIPWGTIQKEKLGVNIGIVRTSAFIFKAEPLGCISKEFDFSKYGEWGGGGGMGIKKISNNKPKYKRLVGMIKIKFS